MKLIAGAMVVGLSLTALPQLASAQAGAAANALSEARSRGVCAGATLVSSQYIGNGMMRVTCRKDGQQEQQSEQARRNPLQDGLTAPVAAGIVAGLVVIGVLVGDDGSATTTSTTGPVSLP
ncbi:hypothetical protein ACFO5X_24380 [Seohaeicola nanhaiensis]|uniref:Uncharacterized protein n=1 Tax=Seohaeicola nanhaiensis TaxID=1387282 RepID=A0ABV9KNG9_9RHOB